MKHVVKISLLLLVALLVALSGCTEDDPGFVNVINEPNVTLVDSSGNAIAVDSVTDTLVTIEYEHHMVHDGVSFKSDVADEDIADAETLIIAFKTPTGSKCIHIVVAYSTLKGGNLGVWESPTWDNQSGTLLPIINRRREGPITQSLLLEDQGQATFVASNNVILNPTNIDLAGEGQILIHHIYAFSDKAIGAGTARDEAEFILRPGTQYAYVFTSSADANKVWMAINWYENET